MEWHRGPPCDIENCRSTRYEDRADGHTYCSRGHQVEGQVATQQEDFGPSGSQNLHGKKAKKVREEREKVSRVLTGRKAVELYLQCLQLVLWKQTHLLVRVKGYPKELETIVRDLWALRLDMLKVVLEDADQDAEPQMFSTQTDTGESEVDVSDSYLERARFQSKIPRLIETVALSYLAMVLLRLPICASDIQSWILEQDFVYLRAVHAVPLEMRRRLPTTLKLHLQPRTGIGELEKLHNATAGLAAAFGNKFGMTFPMINHTLLVFNWISELALPLELFMPVKRLREVLGLDLMFSDRPQRYKLISQHPEICLMCLLIISVKLFYPFDYDVRQPKDFTEPTVCVVSWDAWNEAQGRFRGLSGVPRRRSHAEFLEVNEHDVLSMSGHDVDDYLDWYSRNMVDNEGSQLQNQGTDADFRRAMLGMFPLTSHHHGTERGVMDVDIDDNVRDRLENVKTNQGTLILRRPVSDEDASDGSTKQPLRPGSQYQHYRSTTDVPQRARPFLQAAAGIVCLDLESLVKVVFQVECRVQKWTIKERKRLNLEDENESEDSSTTGNAMEIDG